VGPADVDQGYANDVAKHAAPEQSQYQAALRVPLESAYENDNRSNQGKTDAAQYERTAKIN